MSRLKSIDWACAASPCAGTLPVASGLPALKPTPASTAAANRTELAKTSPLLSGRKILKFDGELMGRSTCSAVRHISPSPGGRVTSREGDDVRKVIYTPTLPLAQSHVAREGLRIPIGSVPQENRRIFRFELAVATLTRMPRLLCCATLHRIPALLN